MRILKRISNSINNNSVLYLALLCLLYFLITSNYFFPPSNSEIVLDGDKQIFIELSKDNISRVKGLSDNKELAKFKSEYKLAEDLKSGDKLVIENDKIFIKKISGRKRISLGVPIGVNSASSEDLIAIQGIGPELAKRIINYREAIGEFSSLDQVDNVEGIGKKKLSSIKKVSNLD